MDLQDLQLELGPEIVLSYKRLSYTPWYALAEFIDNSTQAYYNNEEVLSAAFKKEDRTLEVDIKADKNTIEIKDNSMGMSQDDLKKALAVGIPPDFDGGRSKYGLGMKTAAFWFGNYVTIVTTKLGNPDEITVELDVFKIAQRKKGPAPTIRKVAPEEHYTIITISNLNRSIAYRSKTKVMGYLPSLYRFDIDKGILKLSFNGTNLPWSYQELFSKMDKFTDGEPAIEHFDFDIGSHHVHGWAGVLLKGSRKDAGFSLLQSNRVIKSWPDSFKNDSIFGSQEGGSNTLINQRLTGELYVDGFDVSHTKDEILFADEDYELLDLKLGETLKSIVHFASTRRKDSSPIDSNTRKKFSQIAIESLTKEIGSDEFKDAYNFEVEVPEEVIREDNIMYVEKIKKTLQPSKEFIVGKTKIILYLVDDHSSNDPYLTVESKGERELFVVVNQIHPHWHQLQSEDSVLNFLRHCIYDGLAEWKTSRQLQKIDPSTAKLYKDYFLRIPFKMDLHSRPDTEDADLTEE